MLVIHIGLHKTGSSTLQNHLLLNEQALSAAGFRYAEAGRATDSGGAAHHRLLVPKQMFEGQQWRRVLRERRQHAGQTLILSSETFAKLTREQVVQLADKVGVEDTRIIGYCRPLDTLLPSAYNQLTRYGLNHRDFDRYFAEAVDSPFWARPLAIFGRWASVFGWQRMRVRAVTPQQLPGGALVADFLDALGVPAATQARLQSPPKVNSSWNWKVVEVLRALFASRGSEALLRELRKDPVQRLPYLRVARAVAQAAQGFDWALDTAQYLTPVQAQRCWREFGRAASQLAEFGAMPALPEEQQPALPSRPFLPSIEQIPAAQVAQLMGAAMFAWTERPEDAEADSGRADFDEVLDD